MELLFSLPRAALFSPCGYLSEPLAADPALAPALFAIISSMLLCSSTLRTLSMKLNSVLA